MNSAQGVDPVAGVGGDDWRAHLQSEARGRIVNRIMEALKNHLPVPAPEGLSELQKRAVQFEEKIYAAATSQSDYLRKISLKMLSMESQSTTSTQQNPQNAQVAQNKRSHGLAEVLVDEQIRGQELNLEGTNEQSSGRRSMDSDKGADPSTGAGAADAGDDWRSNLQSEARGRMVNRIMEVLNKHLPVSVPEGLSELQKIAVRFEDKIYAAATSQSDYLRKISLKMLSMESQTTNTQQNPQNAQVVQNQRLHGLASEDSTAQFDYTSAGNWQEELYQMIKTMKNQYLPELGDLCNKISMKLQHIDNHMPYQKFTEQYEKMKNFKIMLERTLQFLQIDKSCVQLGLKDKIPAYERQIVRILNSQKRKHVQTFEQSAGQTPSCNNSRIPVDSAAQTGYPGAIDLHEELYQMNTTLKDQYLAGLSDLYEISTKLHADSRMASQKATDQCEEMSFKLMLERSLHSLKIGKGSVQPTLEESIPMHKRQIISILNSEGWKPEETLQQSAGQAPSTSSSKRPCHRKGAT